MTDQESDELLRCLGSLLFEACLQSHSGTEENGGNKEDPIHVWSMVSRSLVATSPLARDGRCKIASLNPKS